MTDYQSLSKDLSCKLRSALALLTAQLARGLVWTRYSKHSVNAHTQSLRYDKRLITRAVRLTPAGYATQSSIFQGERALHRRLAQQRVVVRMFLCGS
jgi:hypothetical protein